MKLRTPISLFVGCPKMVPRKELFLWKQRLTAGARLRQQRGAWMQLLYQPKAGLPLAAAHATVHSVSDFLAIKLVTRSYF